MFLLCCYYIFPHFLRETCGFTFFFFPFEESFKLVTKLIPDPFFFLFIWSCFFSSMSYRSASLFCTFSAAFCPCAFLLLHECVEYSVVRSDLNPHSSGFHVLPSVYRALPCGLQPSCFRGGIPLSTVPLVFFIRHGSLQNRSCFLDNGSFSSSLVRA